MNEIVANPLSPGPQSPQKRRGGSFVLRMMLQRVAARQDPSALIAAGRIALILPLVQTILLVGVLNTEPWQALLGLEGLVIAALAYGQFRRGQIENKFIGYGIALLNAAALGAVGLALDGHLLWITGLVGMLAMSWLVFARSRPGTVRNAWLAFALPLLLLAAACGFARYGLWASETTSDVAARHPYLTASWYAFALRGGNGTERALLRLRQAQADFAAGDYASAFAIAHDGAYDSQGKSRVPATAIGAELLDSLLRLKAQAYYNDRWHKDEKIWMPIGVDPLPAEARSDETVKLRWGW